MVERVAALHRFAPAREECGAFVRSGGEWLVCQPQTYMNRSGSALRCLAERHELEPAATLLVYDDIHLPLGRLRLRAGGSAAGHRGVESAIEAMQTDALPRLRLGIGAPPPNLGEEGLPEYVLGEFSADEQPRVAAMIERAAEAVSLWLRDGMEAAMRFANSPPPEALDLPEATHSA